MDCNIELSKNFIDCNSEIIKNSLSLLYSVEQKTLKKRNAVAISAENGIERQNSDRGLCVHFHQIPFEKL